MPKRIFFIETVFRLAPVTLPQASLKNRIFMAGVEELQTRMLSLKASNALSNPVCCLFSLAVSKAYTRVSKPDLSLCAFLLG